MFACGVTFSCNFDFQSVGYISIASSPQHTKVKYIFRTQVIEDDNITSDYIFVVVLPWYWKSYLSLAYSNTHVFVCTISRRNVNLKDDQSQVLLIMHSMYIMLIVCCVSGFFKYTASIC